MCMCVHVNLFEETFLTGDFTITLDLETIATSLGRFQQRHICLKDTRGVTIHFNNNMMRIMMHGLQYGERYGLI